MFAEKWWWIIKLKLEFSYLRFFTMQRDAADENKNRKSCSSWNQNAKKKKPEMQLWWQMGKKIKKNNN